MKTIYAIRYNLNLRLQYCDLVFSEVLSARLFAGRREPWPTLIMGDRSRRVSLLSDGRGVINLELVWK